MTQLLLVTTPRQMLLLAAAIDHGVLPPSPSGRVVVLADTVPVPETGAELERSVALAALRRRTLRVVSWTTTISPLRAASFVPRRDEQPVWERLLRERWALSDGPVDLVLADPTSGPGRAFARIFPHARLTMLADRLERWAPARRPLRDGLPGRIDLLLAPELVPGMRPHALDEHGTRTAVMPVRRLVDVVTEVVRRDSSAHPGERPSPDGTALPRPREAASPRAHDTAGTALVLLDAPPDLGLGPDVVDASALKDLDRIVERLAGLVADEVSAAHLGEVELVVHPRATPGQVRRTVGTLRAAGLEVRLADPDVPAEVVVVRDLPPLVVGTASTSLVTALALGAPDVRAVGTADVLASLTPYHHPARTALTVTDRLLAPGADPSASEVVRLLEAVTYVMQPDRVPHLRPAAAALLAEADVRDADGRPAWRRWIRKRRIEHLGLLPRAGAEPEPGPGLGPDGSPTSTDVAGTDTLRGEGAAARGGHVVVEPARPDQVPSRRYRLGAALRRLAASGTGRPGA